MVKTKDDSHGTYDTSNLIRFKTAMKRSSLCDYSDVYIHFKGTIRIWNTAAALAATNNAKKKVMFKNCTPFTKCTSKINNIQVDDAHDIDAIMLMYNLIECSPIYLKIESSM